MKTWKVRYNYLPIDTCSIGEKIVEGFSADDAWRMFLKGKRERGMRAGDFREVDISILETGQNKEGNHGMD